MRLLFLLAGVAFIWIAVDMFRLNTRSTGLPKQETEKMLYGREIGMSTEAHAYLERRVVPKGGTGRAVLSVYLSLIGVALVAVSAFFF